MSAAPRDVGRLVPLAPALLVALTALVAQPGQAGGFRLTKWSAFGLGLGALAVLLAARKAPLRVPQRVAPLVAFVAAAALLPALSSELKPTHWPQALGMLSGLGSFFVTASALGDDDDARGAALEVLVSAGALGALVVLLQAAGLRWLTSDVYTGLEFRSPGTFGNPNWAAAFLAPLVPLALSLAATARAARRRLYSVVSALLAVASVATLSKGGVVTLGAGVLAYSVLGRGVSRRRRVGLVALAAVGAALAGAMVWHPELVTQSPSLRGRLFLWRAALFMVGEHPLSGVGLGAYPAGYGRAAAAIIHGDSSAFMPLSTVDFAHNDLLQFAAESGLVSVAALVVVIVLALARAHREGDPSSRAVGAAIAALVVNGLVDSPLRVPSTFVLFFFLLGWLSPTAEATRSSIYRALLVAIALLGAGQGVRFAAGNASWTRGRDALATAKNAVEPLERARFWIPEHGRSAAQYARALARAGRFADALAASNEAALLRFDFDDEIFRRDLQARSLDRDANIAAWRDLSARFPALLTPQLRLGALYLRSNDRAAAISAYEAVAANQQPTPRAEAARAQARKLLQSLTKTRRAPGLSSE